MDACDNDSSKDETSLNLSNDGKNNAGNNDIDELPKIREFDLIDVTNDEFDDFSFKDPNTTTDTDCNESYDDGIDAQY